MAVRATPQLKQAFKRFVELVEPIEEVRHVVAFEEPTPDLATYISGPDEEVMGRIFAAEMRLLEEFSELVLEFHVWFMGNDSFADMVNPVPSLSYSRMRGGESQHGKVAR